MMSNVNLRFKIKVEIGQKKTEENDVQFCIEHYFDLGLMVAGRWAK